MQTATTPHRRHAGATAISPTQIIRRLVQLAVAAYITYLAVTHTLLGDQSASAEALCPFGGIETLYSYITSGGLINHTHLSNLVILVATIVLAVVARGAFCGWICPLGTIQEWLHLAGRQLRRRIPPLGRAYQALHRWAYPPRRRGEPARVTLIQRLDQILRYGRYLVLALILGGTVAYGTMVFRDYDPWSALLEIASLELTAGLVVLGVVLVSSLVIERPWCRYACPLGAIVGLAGKVSPLRIQREGAACTGCSLCSRRCPMGLPVDKVTDMTDSTCIMCLECVETCPRDNALELRLQLPGIR